MVAVISDSGEAVLAGQEDEPAALTSSSGTPVVMPQMGESIFEGTITKWLKKPGDRVEKDEPLFEISTDKVDAEIPAPLAGILSEIKVPEGSTVQINTVVAVIGGPGTSGPSTQVGAPQMSPVLANSSSAVSVPRRWCAGLPLKTTSILRWFEVPAPMAASPRKTFCTIWLPRNRNRRLRSCLRRPVRQHFTHLGT